MNTQEAADIMYPKFFGTPLGHAFTETFRYDHHFGPDEGDVKHLDLICEFYQGSGIWGDTDGFWIIQAVDDMGFEYPIKRLNKYDVFDQFSDKFL